MMYTSDSPLKRNCIWTEVLREKNPKQTEVPPHIATPIIPGMIVTFLSFPKMQISSQHHTNQF